MMIMYRVLIVEDESIMREGLREGIDWQAYGFEVAGAVENGRKALEFLKNTSVNLVITDVRMQGMDGIELSEHINRSYRGVRVVILSGYADFGYAKAAIKNKVYEYLLKPVKRDEINSVLKRVRSELETENGADGGLNCINKEEAVMSMLLGDGRQQGISGDWSGHSLICAVAAADNFYVYNELEQKQIRKYFESFKRSVFLQKTEGFLSVMLIEDKFAVMILDEGIKNRKTALELFEALCGNISDSECDGCTFSLGVSREYTGLSNLKEMYKEAYEAVKARLYLGDGAYAEYGVLGDYRGMSPREYNEFIRKREELIDSIESGNGDVLGKIDEIYCMLTEKPYIEPDAALKIFRGIANAVSEYIMTHGIKTEQEINNEIRKFTSAANILRFLTKYVEDIVKVSGEEPPGEKDIIRRVKKYVRDNYSQRITLQNIEDTFYVNKSYFSWLFSNVTGQTFTEYIACVRIEEAKKLLGNDSMKVYEIAEAVGYRDYRNFCKTFKKITGVTPLKYRETVARH